MMRHDEAASVAIEHMRWCRKNRISARALLVSMSEPLPEVIGWDDAFIALARAWLRLTSEPERRKAA